MRHAYLALLVCSSAARWQARKDLENAIMKQVDETCFALRLDLAREKKLREEVHAQPCCP